MAWEWVGPTATAAVGVAGIAGASLSSYFARLSALDVARVGAVQTFAAEKRSLYAKFLYVAEEMMDACDVTRAVDADLKELKREVGLARDNEGVGQPTSSEFEERLSTLKERLAKARDRDKALSVELRRLRSEISVAGGPRMGVLASRLIGALSSYAVGRKEGIDEDLTTLMVYMHSDTHPYKEPEPGLLAGMTKEDHKGNAEKKSG